MGRLPPDDCDVRLATGYRALGPEWQRTYAPSASRSA